MKYKSLLHDLSPQCRNINFVNLSMSALDILESSFDTLLKMIKYFGIDTNIQKSIVKKNYEHCSYCAHIVYSVEETRHGLTLIC